MKRQYLVLMSVLLALVASDPGLAARKERASRRGPVAVTPPTRVEQALKVAESIPLRDLPAQAAVPDSGEIREGGPEKTIKNFELPKSAEAETEAAGSPDAAVQAGPSSPLLPAPGPSFDGLSSQDNANLFGFRVSPPDTNGDVGPNHYVQMVNLTLRVWDKSGNPLTAAAKSSSFWGPLGGVCAVEDLGDPIVLYDDMADRFLISQFNVGSEPEPHQCIAISKTGDPTGSWHLYDFLMPNTKFNDYPKFGVWRDAYYMTDNQFDPFFVGAGAFAYDRSKMLVGDPTATYIYFDLGLVDTAIGGVLPADADGLLTPASGAPNVFAFFTANEFLDPEGDGIRLFEFHADFANPGASTFNELPFVPVASFSPLTPPGRDDIEQPPPAIAAASLDSISDRLMHRLQYRNFGTHESLVVTHSVNVGTGNTIATHQSGIRYYELRRTPGGSWTLNEQATFSPDTTNRWMGSAAMDGEGNLAVGYSASSSTVFPSVRYAGRLASDPPGGLFQGEQTMIAGTGVQRSTGSRWGDYSALAIDPVDDCTFWYTTEYYTAASQASSTVGWLTRIGQFKVNPSCQTTPRGTLSGQVTNCETGEGVAGALVQVSNGFSRATVAGGGYSMSLAPGTYDVTASAFGYLPASPQTATITDGGAATANLCLVPVPVIDEGSAVLSKEGCQPRNGVADPGERVHVDITLRNIGAAATDQLKATLLESGGVVNPSGPKDYGDVPPGGEGTRTFSFTAAGACGGDVTMSLELRDLERDLGTAQFTLTLGELVLFPTASATNPAPISILDLSPASPYPSDISVTGLTGKVDKVTATLHGLGHTFPADVAFVLVAPSGEAVTLMAGAGGGVPITGVEVTFDDDAPTGVPTPLVSGTYRPGGSAGTLPPPAPPPPYGSKLSSLRGLEPNGTWKLFVQDQFLIDSGTVAGGWTVNVTTFEHKCINKCGKGNNK